MHSVFRDPGGRRDYVINVLIDIIHVLLIIAYDSATDNARSQHAYNMHCTVGKRYCNIFYI